MVKIAWPVYESGIILFSQRLIVIAFILIYIFLADATISDQSWPEDMLEETAYVRPPIKICSQIAQNTTTALNIPIDAGISSAVFFLNWTKNQTILEFKLISPDGTKVDKHSENIEVSEGLDFISFFLSAPRSGVWIAEIKAIDLMDTQEDYCLLVDQSTDYTLQHDARFNGIFSHTSIDANDDGLLDTISLKVGVNIKVPGMYSLTGSLYDQSGNEILALNRTFLDIGAQRPSLEFSGFNATGQKRIGNFTLYDELGNPIDFVEEALLARAYGNLQQDAQLARLTGDCSDKAIDADGDGIYDFLNVEVGVEALTPGEYTLSANLYSLNGDEITWSIDHSRLSPGNSKMQLDFDGKTIWNEGIDGPYVIKDILLSGSNWSLKDKRSRDYMTSAYNASQFVDPAYPEKIISGSGSGELLITFTIEEALPVFYGRYSRDIVGINIPPLSSPFHINSSESGYAYDADGIYIPGKPNNFTVSADGVKDINIGLRMAPDKSRINAIRTWVTTQIDASPEGRAIAETDLISPGSYHVKIFGDAENNATEVNLVLAVMKKILVEGNFSLSINTTGFPSGIYSIDIKAINGSFEFDELNIGGQF